jgi:hypothetical protein
VPHRAFPDQKGWHDVTTPVRAEAARSRQGTNSIFLISQSVLWGMSMAVYPPAAGIELLVAVGVGHHAETHTTEGGSGAVLSFSVAVFRARQHRVELVFPPVLGSDVAPIMRAG